MENPEKKTESIPGEGSERDEDVSSLGQENEKGEDVSESGREGERDENVSESGKESDSESAASLQHSDIAIALRKALAENHQLREENAVLREKLAKSEKNRKAAVSRGKKASPDEEILKRKLRNTETKMRNLQVRYDALSHSKLGRLTLYYWEKKNAKKRKKNVPAQISQTTQIPPTEAAPRKARKLPPEQENWLSRYTDRINAIPESSGSRYYEKLKLKIGIVCDEILWDSMESAADFLYITPDNWQAAVDAPIDVLLFVSAWRGLHNEWRGNASISNFENDLRKTACQLIDTCNERSIPTIFYSKEDPPNYEIFVDYAKKCKYIFTSALECVPYYIKDCGNENVYAIPFGVNPRFHNPVGFYRADKERTVLFSGSWMAKYPDRCRALSMMFDGVLASEYSLHIIDRNYPEYAFNRYKFPDAYSSYLSPSVDHSLLQKVHKLFNWSINVNSVTSSETMFANRAFELQANGDILFSNYSVGVNSLLPYVQIVHSAGEVTDILNRMSDEEIYAHQLAGIRYVLRSHTCFERINEILACAGLDSPQKARTVLVVTRQDNDAFRKNYERQTYLDREYILAENLDAAALGRFDMVTWFDPEAYYGEFYLEDMINGFKYTGCDYITKDAYLSGGVLTGETEHGYVEHMGSPYRTVFWREAFPDEFFLKEPEPGALPNGYSADHMSYDEKPAQKVRTPKNYKLSVIIPVYNNGDHLYGKCFSSLLRSSMFEDMEIIFVDDGSTDDRTPKIESYLADRYDNIVVHRFEDGGSGSAARPRNYGVSIASAEYITYLDPDNEAVCDGYAKLYEAAAREDLDLALGDMIRCDTKVKPANNYGYIVNASGRDTFYDGFGDTIARSDFHAVSIQAMVIRKSLITEHHFEQVVGAAGQDSLFSWQLMQAARRLKAIDLPIHVYYAQTAGSVTNSVGPRFFEKQLAMQKPKLDWLVEQQLIDDFMDRRYNYYTRNWLFQKLSIASEPGQCAQIVKQMLDVFAPYYQDTDDLINEFTRLCENGDYDGAARTVRDAFPQDGTRPMPTLDELRVGAKRISANAMKIDCEQTENQFVFTNRTETDSGATFAWVILYDRQTYEKIYSTKHEKSRTFQYDFSTLPPERYKVRAFIIDRSGKKRSLDVAYIEVNEDAQAQFKESESIAVLEEKK